MNRGYFPRSIAITTAIIVAMGVSQLAHAQGVPLPGGSSVPPTGSQAPTPSPPNVVPPPTPFQSPFPKDGPGAAEEGDFNKLVALWDKFQAAGDALKKAYACGSLQDLKAASEAESKAQQEFRNALDQYVKDYSNTPYPQIRLPILHPEARTDAERQFFDDGLKVDAAVKKASKYKHVSIGDCPKTLGMYFGGDLLKNFGTVQSTETLAATSVVTNQFDDSGDPIGFGVVVGDNFAFNKIVVGPFVSFDVLNQTINHTFPAPAGSFLGTTAHWSILAGAKVGVVATPLIFVYGLGGISGLNEDLNINFGPGRTSSSTTTTTGFAFGGGAEFRPGALQRGRVPLAVFLQYQHTAWQNASLNNPTAAPGYNYTFGRSDDTIKVGVDVHLHK